MNAGRIAFVMATTAMLVAFGPRGVSDHDDSALLACGPFIDFPVFTDTNEPDVPSFVSGNLGILQTGYRRRYLVAAWRILEERPLTTAERQAYLAAPAAPSRETPRDAWFRARNMVNGLPTTSDVPNPNALLTDGGRYRYITNCNDDAFRTAVATLEDRRVRWGLGEPLYEWVRAQDLVFANCGRREGTPATIPRPLPAGAAPGERADRDYQIAAAMFYAGQFADAERAFTRIAADGMSVWRTLAPYLAARALVRQGTLGGTEPEGDPAALRRAEHALDAILADSRLADIHERAWRLRQFVRVRLHPTEVLRDIAVQLETPRTSGDFGAGLADLDYLVGWRMIPTPAFDAATSSGTPLLEWLGAVQSGRPDHEALIARWRRTPTPAWLVAAMMVTPPDAPGVDDLLAASTALDRNSPAQPTVQFHRARILMRRGRLDEARSVLSEALATPGMSRSSVNLLKGARFVTARTLDEFVDDGVRSAIGEITDRDDVRELEPIARRDASYVLDRDVLAIVNERLPVSTLQRLAAHPRVPPNVRRELLQMIFVRLWLLDRLDGLRGVLPEVRASEPGLARAIARLEKTDDRQLADETALLLLYTPGLRPYVPAWSFRDNWNVRYGGLTGLSSLRDNWWCRFDRVTGSYYTPHLKGVGAVPEPLDGLREATTPIDPVFLAPAERQRAADELAILMSRDSGSNELAQRVVGWARRNPQDPRAPEALHRVVRGVRVGCNNENSGTLAKAAFELLHTRYGKSPWAARTPYWYR